jgi:hypothetical protein
MKAESDISEDVPEAGLPPRAVADAMAGETADLVGHTAIRQKVAASNPDSSRTSRACKCWLCGCLGINPWEGFTRIILENSLEGFTRVICEILAQKQM